MKITVLSNTKLETPYNNVISKTPVLNDDSDVVIVYSDDYFDDNLFRYLKRLKRKYMAVFVIGFNNPELMLYNKQYVEFCFDNNINFLDFDQDTSDLNSYLEQNLSFTDDYTKFAHYYIKLQPEIDYTAWFGQEKLVGCNILDLGCGAAEYVKELEPASYHGIDLSPVMIDHAKENNPDHTFAVGDITNYEYSADCIISILDVLNYLPNFDTVKLVIEQMYNNLTVGGQVIFDIHSKQTLRNFKDYFDFEDDEDGQFIWESKVEGHALTHYFQIIDNDYKVYVEKHKQMYYDRDLILKHMELVGFKNITVTDDYNHHIIKATKESDE